MTRASPWAAGMVLAMAVATSAAEAGPRVAATVAESAQTRGATVPKAGVAPSMQRSQLRLGASGGAAFEPRLHARHDRQHAGATGRLWAGTRLEGRAQGERGRRFGVGAEGRKPRLALPVAGSVSLGVAYSFMTEEDLPFEVAETGAVRDDYRNHQLTLQARWAF